MFRFNKRTKDYTVKSWQEYFEKCLSVKVENGNEFCVYEKGNNDCSPLVVFIHGGGFSALSWALCVVSTYVHKNSYVEFQVLIVTKYFVFFC